MKTIQDLLNDKKAMEAVNYLAEKGYTHSQICVVWKEVCVNCGGELNGSDTFCSDECVIDYER